MHSLYSKMFIFYTSVCLNFQHVHCNRKHSHRKRIFANFCRNNAGPARLKGHHVKRKVFFTLEWNNSKPMEGEIMFKDGQHFSIYFRIRRVPLRGSRVETITSAEQLDKTFRPQMQRVGTRKGTFLTTN